MTEMTQKEPLVRLARRDQVPRIQAWGIRLLSFVLGMLVCAFFLHSITGLDPLAVYASMFKGAFGSESRLWVTLKDTSLLLCVSAALAPAFKMRFWNIGAEGQILIGGLISAACMIYIGDAIPNWLLLVLMAVLAMAGGAFWGWIPAYYKARYRTNETLFTLMMNYIALQLVEFCVDLWDKKQSHSVGVLNAKTRAGWLPAAFGQQYGLLLVIVLLVTVAVYIYLGYTKHGYEIAVVGESENTARYAGMPVRKIVLRTMLLSGAIAGLAGFLEVAGVSHTISSATAGGRGFTAIIVAWLAKFNTIAMILLAFLLSFLDRGAAQIASDFNFNKYGSDILIGILLFFILGGEFFISYQLRFRSGKEEKA